MILVNPCEEMIGGTTDKVTLLAMDVTERSVMEKRHMNIEKVVFLFNKSHEDMFVMIDEEKKFAEDVKCHIAGYNAEGTPLFMQRNFEWKNNLAMLNFIYMQIDKGNDLLLDDIYAFLYRGDFVSFSEKEVPEINDIINSFE